jgi:hypothetical protein
MIDFEKCNKNISLGGGERDEEKNVTCFSIGINNGDSVTDFGSSQVNFGQCYGYQGSEAVWEGCQGELENGTSCSILRPWEIIY